MPGGRPPTRSAASAGAQTGEPAARRVVALVRSLHGLDGTVRVEVLTDRAEERFAPGNTLFLEGTEVALTIAWSTAVADGPGWRLRFRERPDRAAAESLRGQYLEARVDPAADLAQGEVYWHEVVGVPVTDLAGTPLGTVADVYRTGGAEVYVVRGGPAGEFDLPAVEGIVAEFAPREGRIVVDRDALALEEAGEAPPSRAPSPARLERGIRRRQRKAEREAEIERAKAAIDAATAAETAAVIDGGGVSAGATAPAIDGELEAAPGDPP